MIGSQLAHYRIESKLGEGGMGEVYLARDTKLDRDVALKLLPEALAADVDRLARFEREAKLLASLNHANIAALYGLEDDGGRRFIVMELVDGETLAEHVKNAGRIALDEALEIAVQIAAALETAHDSGIVHRDLKPANVMITAGGQVKVLDFGLAKAYDADGSPAEGSADISNSPTIMGATRTGMIMGTAAYMSPEQAAGAAVDKRTDIWAFGVVLYEMLAGTKLFAGESVAHILADVIRAEPDFDKLPAETPAAIRKLLRRCLNKKPEQRLRDIGDARLEIEDAGQGPEATPGHGANGHAHAARSPWRRAFPWVVAAAASVAAVAFGVGSMGSAPAPVARTLSIVHDANAGQRVGTLSPDGTMLAYWGADSRDSNRTIVIQDLVSGEERVVHAIDGVLQGWYPKLPWSWDSSAIVAQYTLRDGRGQRAVVIAVAGGSSRIVKQGDDGLPLWTVDGDLVFAASSAIQSLSLADGQTQTLIEAAAGQDDLRREVIQPLADGTLLYEERAGRDADIIRIVHFDGEESTLVRELPVTTAQLWQYAEGFLMGVGDDGLVALPYDAASHSAVGAPWRLIPDIGRSEAVTFSHEGTMIFLAGSSGPRPGADILWSDRNGGELSPLASTADGTRFSGLELSPDGSRIAVTVDDEIWIYDTDSDAAPLRLPGDGALGVAGWMPDGVNLVVGRTTDTEAREREVIFSLESAAGTGAQTELLRTTIPRSPGLNAILSPNGGHLLYGGGRTRVRGAVIAPPAVVTIDAAGTVADAPPLTRITRAQDVGISPNGRWMAFAEADRATGVQELWLASFPEGASPRRIGNGNSAFWSPGGTELFFIRARETSEEGTTLMAVNVDPDTGTPTDAPREAFAVADLDDQRSVVSAVSADGESFLVIRPRAPNAGNRRVMLVEDWTRLLPEEMRRGR